MFILFLLNLVGSCQYYKCVELYCIQYIDTKLYESNSKLGNAANAAEAISLADEWIGGIRNAWPSAITTFSALNQFPDIFPGKNMGKPIAAAIASSDGKEILFWRVIYPIELKPSQREDAAPLLSCNIQLCINGQGNEAILGGMDYNWRGVKDSKREKRYNFFVKTAIGEIPVQDYLNMPQPEATGGKSDALDPQNELQELIYDGEGAVVKGITWNGKELSNLIPQIVYLFNREQTHYCPYYRFPNGNTLLPSSKFKSDVLVFPRTSQFGEYLKITVKKLNNEILGLDIEMFVKVFSFNPKYKGLNENQKFSLEEKLKINISKHLCNQIERDNNLYSFTTIVHFKIVDSLQEISPDDYIIYVVEKWPVNNPNNIKAFVPLIGGKLMYVKDFEDSNYIYSHEIGHMLGLFHKGDYRMIINAYCKETNLIVSDNKLQKVSEMCKTDNLMYNKENDLQDSVTYQMNRNPILEEFQFILINSFQKNQLLGHSSNSFLFESDWQRVNNQLNRGEVSFEESSQNYLKNIAILSAEKILFLLSNE